MDKNAIKRFAVWARTELIERVTKKIDEYIINADADPNADAVRGRLLTKDEKAQRAKLIAKVKEKGMEHVVEEGAYTWFNRFSALRFMEVNNYLPSRVRVFTDAEGTFHPQILTEAIHMELKGLDMDKVYALKEADDKDALFRYLIITQCNALSDVLPGMFQKIADYTELLFPDNLLREGSVIEKMVVQGKADSIPEDDWKDQIQIIGWLYQYYNTEPKEKVFGRPSGEKIRKEDVPAATQLFTPDWIVRYMVENSLGHLWTEGHPDTDLKSGWKYYIEEAEQEPNAQKQLAEIQKEYVTIKPEDIRVIDPCSGSGHICAYLFDVLMQIYNEYGIQAHDAVRSIIINNLWGLDIDARASQLAYFSVMMKAVQYDPRFLRRKDNSGNPDIPQPHIYSICESNHIDSYTVDYFINGNDVLKKDIDILIGELHDAMEYGSLLNVSKVNFDALYKRFAECKNEINISQQAVQQELYPLVQVAQALAQEYHVVVTNPPYMGRRKSMNDKLACFMDEHYKNTKMDLFSAFIERNIQFTKKNFFAAYMTPFVWLYLSSFEDMRELLLKETHITTYVQPEENSFKEAAVSICSFVLRKSMINYNGSYIRLSSVSETFDQEKAFLMAKESQDVKFYHEICMYKFNKIPNSRFIFWMTDKLISIFNNSKSFEEVARPRQGMATSDNNRFLRLWYEVDISKIQFNCESCEEAENLHKKWFPYNKGGGFRKWYGNNAYVVNYENNGREIKKYAAELYKSFSRTIKNIQFYFKKCITWSDICGSSFAARACDKGYIFDVKGSSAFVKEKYYEYILAFLNSTVSVELLNMLNPSITTQVGDLKQLPLRIDDSKIERIKNLVLKNIEIAKFDWDSQETSWDFKTNYLCKETSEFHFIKEACDNEIEVYKNKIQQLKSNEEQINSLFIEIYDLGGEISSTVNEDELPLTIPSYKKIIIAFISYAVGCIFGRYSYNHEGLIFAGGKWNSSFYEKITVDRDGIIPICDDEYFDDDITGLFVRFVETVYGKDTLEENLNFIADALCKNGSPREGIRDYFLNDFYADHCSTYSITGSGKRPIYWLFDSGKKNGFKCLTYMHRYQPDTIARIRTDYVHEQQARYHTAIEGLERQLVDATTSERVHLNKQLMKLKDQAEEVRVYEEKIHHLADQMISIDLDDGVKHNYEIFQDVLAKIK